VGQRGQISAATQRAEFVHQWGDSSIQNGGHRLSNNRACSRAARAKGLQAKKHEGTNYFALNRLAHSGGVRANKRLLQLNAIFDCNVAVG
jgi:hypothetical protein